MLDKVSMLKRDDDLRQQKNLFALDCPEVGDAWQDHFVWCVFVIGVFPETKFWPDLIVTCSKITVDDRHWSWDLNETKKPYEVHTLESYNRKMCHTLSTPWADVEKGRFQDFIPQLDQERIQQAVKKWKRQRFIDRFNIPVEWFRQQRRRLGKWIAGDLK